MEVTPGGEHVIGAAGEVHLETCLKDLRERFSSNIEIRVIISFKKNFHCLISQKVSPPLVTFHETISRFDEVSSDVTMNNNCVKVIDGTTPTGICAIRVKAYAMSSD